jgi:hypothetical protein
VKARLCMQFNDMSIGQFFKKVLKANKKIISEPVSLVPATVNCRSKSLHCTWSLQDATAVIGLLKYHTVTNKEWTFFKNL